MFEIFDATTMAHHGYEPHTGDASQTVLPRAAYEAASKEITKWDGYAPTPLHNLNALAQAINVSAILYKDEGPRFGLGSFKALGGAYAALRVLQNEIGKTQENVTLADVRSGRYASDAAGITIVSATDGNHGRSLAWGCQRFGAPCRIYIHADVSEGRAQAMRDLGATVVRIDGDYDASVALAREEADANGWFVVSDTSWEGYTEPPRDVMTGYGVMVDEVTASLDQAPTHVFLQGGVGGLAASVCAAFRQFWGENSPRVVIVEPDLAACLYVSAKADAVTAFNIEIETVMAGLSCGEPSEMAWEILREEAQDFVTISDELIAPTVRLLARPMAGDPMIEAGESAVAGLSASIAAARNDELRTALGIDENSRIILFGSEGVTDPAVYAEMMKE